MAARRLLWLLPLALFAGLIALMAGNLGRPPQAIVKSHMIGKPVPDFELPGPDGGPGLRAADLKGQGPLLVNLFASWCLPCAVEAPQLEALRAGGATIHGIAVRDTPDKTAAFLARHGNPFARIGDDPGGRLMLAFGASGVPETYVIDGRGIIRHQHLGEIRPEHVPELLAELAKAR
jgi:cytochrome c biogenesis protein CcmG/thiol:disulfide interchange protein DsbE